MRTKKEKSDSILVLSWGGSKGLYSCGVLKAIEELGLKDRIQAIYGVSAGALTGAYRASGRKAEEILENFLKSGLFSLKNFAMPPKLSLLKGTVVEKILTKDLKSDFSDLEIPLYVGATDIGTAKFLLFSEGKLVPPVMGSMAVPGIFPPISFEEHVLVDGGILNNFPIDLAKEAYPESKIIGILLGKFKKHQKVTNMLENLSVCYEVAMRGRLTKNLTKADLLIHRELNIGMLETDEKKIRKIFKQGYEDGLKSFSS